MKKLLAILLCLSMVMCCFVGCAEEAPADDQGDANAPAETYEIVIGHPYAETSLENQQMIKLQELVAEKTNGAVEVTVYPAEQLGSEKDMCEQVVMGTLDVCFSEGSMWATVTNTPALGVLGLPFQYKAVPAMNEVITDVVRGDYAKLAEGTGIVPIFTVGSGMRHVLSVGEPIKSLEDFAGVKIRVPAVTLYVQIFECLGANPTTTAFSECYQALQQGVVEGAEIDIPNMVQQNWQEVVDYMTYTYHLAALNIGFINEAKWESIPAEIQDQIIEACIEAEEYSFEIRANADAEYLETVTAAGVEIIELDDATAQQLREACQPIYDEFAQYPGCQELMDVVAEINAKY